MEIGTDNCSYTISPGCLRQNSFDGNESMDISPYPFGLSHCISKGAPVFSLSNYVGTVWNIKDIGDDIGLSINIWHFLPISIELYDGTILPKGTQVYIHYGYLDQDKIVVAPGDLVEPGDLIGYVNTRFGTWEYGVFVFGFSPDGSDLSIDPVLLGMSFPGSLVENHSN